MSLSPWKYDFIKENLTTEEVLEISVRAASLAPSTHNSQPWEVSIAENSVTVHDAETYLPHSDPEQRFHWISVGCFVENFAVSAAYYGYETDVKRKGQELHLEVKKKNGYKGYGHLLPQIPRRYSEKRVFKSGPFPDTANLDTISGKGQHIQIFTDRAIIENAATVQYGVSKSYKNNLPFAKELSSWLKISRRHHVGMHHQSSDLRLLKLILGKSALVFTSKPLAVMAKKYLRLVGTSSAVGFIEAGSKSADDSLHSGRILERLALLLTSYDLSLTPLAAMTESKDGNVFLKSISKKQNSTPVMFFRICDRKEPLYHTTRKPYNIVLRK